MSFYDFPKDILVKLISTLQEGNRYFVFRMYYKDAEYYIETFDNEEELKKYLIEDIEEKMEHLGKEFEYDRDLETLIKISKKLGYEYLGGEIGYGVVEVFKGERL